MVESPARVGSSKARPTVAFICSFFARTAYTDDQSIHTVSAREPRLDPVGSSDWPTSSLAAVESGCNQTTWWTIPKPELK